MADRFWTNTSGDWYSSTWIENGALTTQPVAGDTAILENGTVVLSAADAATGSQGTLDNIFIDFAYSGTGTIPTLDVSNVTFGSGITISTPFTGDFGDLIARGMVSFAGTLNALNHPLTLNIEPIANVATFTNTGLIEASNNGVLSLIGGAGAVLTNSASMLATSFGTMDVAVGLTSTNQGSISAIGGTLDLSGNVVNQGTMFASASLGSSSFFGGLIDIIGYLGNVGAVYAPAFATIEVMAGLHNVGTMTVNGGTLSLAGDIYNGTSIVLDAGTLALAGTLDNLGTITVAGGTATLTGGTLTNSGLIDMTGGSLTINGTLHGLGTVSLNGVLTLDAVVAPTQTITFGSTDSTIDLGNASTFSGVVSNMTGHDVIDVNGTITSTSYNSSTQLLTLFDGATQVGAFTLAGGAVLNTVTDGHGGTFLTPETIGTPSQVETYMVANNADTYNGQPAIPHPWPAPHIVYYTFDSTSTLDSADKSAFLAAMTLYEDVANITFEAAGGVHAADLLLTTNATGGAQTSYSVTLDAGNTVASQATISIDTATPGWTNLASLGTADTSGYGNYGFTTLLHELGHAIGFGHPGPYNDSGTGLASYLPSQVFFTDTRQYTVMSYIDAAQSGASYIFGGNTIYPQTPMLYDIGAAQQIYGANTATLNGNDTFGFNSTFGTLSAHPVASYDFTQNQQPIVTFYDGGANNTLDLSGFTAASTVDLTPGTFSSADTMVNNLAIAANTTINTAIGGAGNDIFYVNANSDTINGGGGTNKVVFANVRGDYSYNFGPTIDVTSDITGVVDTLTNVQGLVFSDSAVLACFHQGTRIRTTQGEVAVEELRVGTDQLVTACGRIAPITWIGSRTLDPARHPRPHDVLPVRIRAGAIAPQQPARDLLLSPDHAVALDGALVPVRYLLNGATIAQEAPRGAITYFHVELDRHDILLAEALPSESFLDTGNRGAFTEGGAALQLHPDFALRIWATEACAPLLTAGAPLAALRARLAGRAAALGYATTTDPDLCVLADGRPLPVEAGGVTLPPGTQSVRLVTRAWVPLHMDMPGADPRRLGVAVAGLALDGVTLPLDDARLGAGWHAAEAHWRWTDGDAQIAVAGARRLDFAVVTTGYYWTDPSDRRRAAG